MKHPHDEAIVPTALQTIPALRSISSLRASRVLALAFAFLMVASAALLAVVPWQQNVRGSGRVIALAPNNRMQTIAAPVVGRVRMAWVTEGSRVDAGDPLLEIVDNAADIVERLDQQRGFLRAGRSAATVKVGVYEDQVQALEQARELAMSAAEQQIEVAAAKVRSERHGLEAALAASQQAGLNFARQRDLYSEGLAALAELEVAERVDKQARAKVEQARQALRAARNQEQSKRADLGRIATEAQAKIESARAAREAANAEVANKEKQLSEIDVRINQQSTQLLRAPRAGTVFRLLVNPGAELVKAGDPLLILVPETEDRAVELWMDGNDVPLIHEGRPVRIQFEGWPAVQFAGWPSVAIGTFGGRVSLVDRTDDGGGRFRILVVPDTDDQPWPESDFLRQGARAKGFVLLDRVRLGYELWRQANGFPPTVAMRGENTGRSRGKK